MYVDEADYTRLEISASTTLMDLEESSSLDERTPRSNYEANV
jgi:hypothetical protein